jgi:glycosyltransferase involved in cell wall biosynthesis
MMAEHILYIHQYFVTPQMSGGTRSYEMARRLVADGHKVTILTSNRATGFRWPSRETVEGINVIWVPCPYSNAYGPVRKIASFSLFALLTCFYALWLRYDLIFATSTPLTTGVPALLAKWLRRKRYVFEVRDLWPEMPIAVGSIRNPTLMWILERLESAIYRNAIALVGLSPGMSEGIEQVLAKSNEVRPVFTAPNSCDFDKIPSPGKPEYDAVRTCVRDSLNIKRDQTMLLYAGTFGLLNDLEYACDLAAATLDNRDIVYVLVGSGIRAPAIQERVAREGLSNVRLTGKIPKHLAMDYFAACDVGLSLFVDIPEMEKNSANKFFDTLAAGKPVVINYGGWQKDFLAKTRVGIQLPRDIEQAKENLTSFIKDDMHNLTANIVHEAAAPFGRDRVYAEVYQAISIAFNR